MPRLLLQLDAALGQRQRLLVAVLHHRDVRLVAAHRRQHVAGLDDQREPLGLAQRGHRFVEPPFLRERDARQRVDQREVAPIAGGVQRRGGLRDVLADDGGVADLAVAVPELVVGEADGARVVGALGLLQRPWSRKAMPRDGSPRADASRPCSRQSCGQARRIEPLARFGRAAERLGRLADVVLQQPGFGERAADLDLFVAGQSRVASAAGRAGRPPRRRGPVPGPLCL